ncbi:TetR family transcriptional regulator [Streptomyces paludis]|uniref:TetR family transcriptional regulator n=1 Tax=Streptomyces paludis TaxID=2282738 RepID=A0A345HZF0_9ACTN|nr:TetR/AcrR family transcriptional regulator [Streptomyces paludis]AXG82074.1 TetR family transcriptional regulator [Streptomyces paludis]
MNSDGTVPGLRERKKRATRAALAEAAVRLAAEHGAENVTVEAISEAAGVSPRTFFNYFECHDDAFVMLDPEAGQRIRRAVRETPAGPPALAVVRDAMAAELRDVEEQHEIWSLRAKVLQRSPHLLVRGLGLHIAEEVLLAEAIADRLAGGPVPDGRPAERAGSRAGADGRVECGPLESSGLGLYPRLLAAVATTAVRVAVEHSFAQGRPGTFSGIFRRVFDQLAAGLAEPPTGG